MTESVNVSMHVCFGEDSCHSISHSAITLYSINDNTADTTHVNKLHFIICCMTVYDVSSND